MKISNLFFILLVVSALTFSCKSERKEASDAVDEAVEAVEEAGKEAADAAEEGAEAVGDAVDATSHSPF